MVLSARVLAVAVAALPAAASASEAAGWLPADGRSADWRKATARCRELLGRLDTGRPLVRRHLPDVRRCAQMLRRTDALNWKAATAPAYLEAMLTDLLAGREPKLRYAGKQLAFPYWSATMRRIEAIWIHVPPGYDAARRYCLLIYYKCGGGIHLKDGRAAGGYRPTAEVANRTEAFHAWSSLSIQVKGRMGAERELAEAPAALSEAFSVDRDRVVLTGWSDGGFTAVWLASRWPHLVAGIAPACANWQYGNVGDVGLLNVPMLCVDGWFDGGYNTIQFARWHALHTMGADAAGLWGHHGHSYKPYEDTDEFRRIVAWAKTKRRDPWPRRVRYATWNLTWHGAYWVSIERMAEPALAARIDVEVKDDNRIDVRASNVGAYTLRLGEKLVEMADPVTVRTNGSVCYRGPCKGELRIELTKRPAGRFVKSAQMPGGITAQMERSAYQASPGGGLRIPSRRWMWVRPTGGDAKTRKLLAGWAPSYAIDDTAVTDRQIAEANLLVFGGPSVSRFASRIASELPVRFGEGRFTVGGRTYDGPTHCVKLIHPNPLNPSKYVILYAFNDAAAFAANGFFGTKTESTWTFRSGDCVVMGIPRRRRTWGVGLAGGAFEKRHLIFDAGWKAPEAEPVGRLAAPFSYAQLLRLRADAAREATGADVAIIGGYAPRWCRWRPSLPAGPVTPGDLATAEMFPEYVYLCDVRGDQLKRLIERGAASTTDASQVEAGRTYRAALGYRGLPTYRAEPKKAPPLHAFRTPAEFLAGGATSLPVRNLRISETQMAAAVTDYVRKRKALAPRTVRGDLVQYVMDPQANELSAYDWLHFGADVPGEPTRRYTLALGLREQASPAHEAPKDTARRFIELDLSGRLAAKADCAGFGRRLPLTASATIRSFGIVAGKAGVSFRAVAGGAAGEARCSLVEVRLVNRGKKEIEGLAVLSPTAMRRVEGGTWPDKTVRRPLTTWYAGYRDTAGPVKRPTRQTAGLLLFDRAGARLGRLVVRQAGYNFGLVGIHRPVRVGAVGTTSIGLLLIRTDRPGMDLRAAVEALKGKAT